MDLRISLLVRPKGNLLFVTGVILLESSEEFVMCDRHGHAVGAARYFFEAHNAAPYGHAWRRHLRVRIGCEPDNNEEL